MEYIKLLSNEEAPKGAKEILDGIKAKGSRVINIFKAMANSSAVLKTFFGIAKALEDKSLSNEIAERIAIQMAAINGCEYCMAAHSYSGSKILSEDEVSLARQSKSNDAKTQAALDFAASVMAKAGKVSDEELEKIKNAGFSDGEILEIATVVAQNFFTNAINNIAHTEVDFPKPKM